MDGAKIVSMGIELEAYDWMEKEFDHLSKSEQAKKLASLEVDFDIDLSRLESLELNLNSAISQKKQLQQFVGLPSLRVADVLNLSIEGAQFILETQERWPRGTTFEFQPTVSEKLQEALTAKFY